MNDDEKRLFNALCDLMIYHYCDLLRPKTTGKSKFARSVRLLKDKGIIENRNDTGTIGDRYNEMVEEFAIDVMPNGYTSQYDYWGAKIISDNTGWNAPKTGLFSGDGHGMFMLFDNADAMEEYAEEKLTEINERELEYCD